MIGSAFDIFNCEEEEEEEKNNNDDDDGNKDNDEDCDVNDKVFAFCDFIKL